MPKGRNQDVERSIMLAAWNLFLDKGCRATSYTDIAERSGISRPLVQYYFPKKTALVAACVRAIRIAALELTSERTAPDQSWFSAALISTEMQIAAFLSSAQSRRLLLDILGDRELTHQLMVDFYVTGEQFSLGHDIQDMDMPDNFIIAVGGLCELLFVYLKRGETPDVANAIRPCAVAVASLHSPDESWSAVGRTVTEAEAHLLSNDELAPLGKRIIERACAMLSESGISGLL